MPSASAFCRSRSARLGLIVTIIVVSGDANGGGLSSPHHISGRGVVPVSSDEPGRSAFHRFASETSAGRCAQGRTSSSAAFGVTVQDKFSLICQNSGLSSGRRVGIGQYTNGGFYRGGITSDGATWRAEASPARTALS
jgi:hypothetical protein